MKAALIVAFFTLAALKAMAQQTPAAELAATLENFKQAFARQDAAEAKAIAPIKTTYLQEISRVRDAAKARGDLGSFVEAEAALTAAQGDVPPPNVKRIGAAIAQAYASYERGREASLRRYAPGRPQIQADSERAMAALEQKFTRAGDLEDAKKVRDARWELAAMMGGNIVPNMKGESEIQAGLTSVKAGKTLVTEHTFAAPIEVTYVLLPEDQVRINYAANQIIFNWEVDPTELRLDGGPAAGQHQKGAGTIPRKAWVTIRQVVRNDEMALYVNGELRLRRPGNFSKVNAPIKITAVNALQVKQITVHKLE